MKRKYRELLIRLDRMAAGDLNYYVGGFEGDECRAQGFFFPGREILIHYFVDGEWTGRREMEVYNIPSAEQDHLCSLEWRIAKPISAIDQIARVTMPEHLTIFDEERKRAALSENADASSTSDSEPQTEQT